MFKPPNKKGDEKMQSILTILPQPFYNKITKLWNELEKNFNVKWVKNNVP